MGASALFHSFRILGYYLAVLFFKNTLWRKENLALHLDAPFPISFTLDIRSVKRKLPLFEAITRREKIGRDLVHMEANYINKEVLPNIPIDRVLTIFDALVIYKEDEDIAEEYINRLETFNDAIKFHKDELPGCEEAQEKEGSHAV